MLQFIRASMKRKTIRNRPSRSEQVLGLARGSAVLRSRDLGPLGIPRVHLRRLLERGALERIGRGLYALPGADVTEHHSLAAACKRVPRGVVCLLSALAFHGLGTQAPREVWLAVGPGSRAPRAGTPPLRIVRMAGDAGAAGVEEHVIEGVPVKVFGAAKTVADCFKFRNAIGLDVALEALRAFRGSRRGGLDDLWKFARICRVANVLRPYLEAIG
jgi:predicted transcriptional regulator of viral defense system